MAIEKTGLDNVRVRYRPRLLADNGPCYVSGELKNYLDKIVLATRAAHPIIP